MIPQHSSSSATSSTMAVAPPAPTLRTTSRVHHHPRQQDRRSRPHTLPLPLQPQPLQSSLPGRTPGNALREFFARNKNKNNSRNPTDLGGRSHSRRSGTTSGGDSARMECSSWGCADLELVMVVGSTTTTPTGATPTSKDKIKIKIKKKKTKTKTSTKTMQERPCPTSPYQMIRSTSTRVSDATQLTPTLGVTTSVPSTPSTTTTTTTVTTTPLSATTPTTTLVDPSPRPVPTLTLPLHPLSDPSSNSPQAKIQQLAMSDFTGLQRRRSGARRSDRPRRGSGSSRSPPPTTTTTPRRCSKTKKQSNHIKDLPFLDTTGRGGSPSTPTTTMTPTTTTTRNLNRRCQSMMTRPTPGGRHDEEGNNNNNRNNNDARSPDPAAAVPLPRRRRSVPGGAAHRVSGAGGVDVDNASVIINKTTKKNKTPSSTLGSVASPDSVYTGRRPSMRTRRGEAAQPLPIFTQGTPAVPTVTTTDNDMGNASTTSTTTPSHDSSTQGSFRRGTLVKTASRFYRPPSVGDLSTRGGSNNKHSSSTVSNLQDTGTRGRQGVAEERSRTCPSKSSSFPQRSWRESFRRVSTVVAFSSRSITTTPGEGKNKHPSEELPTTNIDTSSISNLTSDSSQRDPPRVPLAPTTGMPARTKSTRKKKEKEKQQQKTTKKKEKKQPSSSSSSRRLSLSRSKETSIEADQAPSMSDLLLEFDSAIRATSRRSPVTSTLLPSTIRSTPNGNRHSSTTTTHHRRPLSPAQTSSCSRRLPQRSLSVSPQTSTIQCEGSPSSSPSRISPSPKPMKRRASVATTRPAVDSWPEDGRLVSPSRFHEFISGTSTRSIDKKKKKTTTTTKEKKAADSVPRNRHPDEMEGMSSSPQSTVGNQELNPRIVLLGQRVDYSGLISPIRRQVLSTKARNNPALILF